MTADNEMVDKTLEKISSKAVSLIQKTDVEPPHIVHNFVLAEKFRYDVEKGGFSQLIFNLQGREDYLKDIETMLSEAECKVALKYYLKCIQILLKSIEEYHAFIESAYTVEGRLKKELQLLSVDYFNEGIGFTKEFEEYFSSNEPFVNDWINTQRH